MSIRFQQWGDDSSQEQVLFIHGWAMNSSVWTDIAEALMNDYPQKLIRAVDLPGYGASEYEQNSTSEALAKALEPLLIGKQTILIAWSMGGLIALDLVTRKQCDIRQLILVSSTPCFVQNTHWQYAVKADVFESFAQSLKKDYKQTLKRFVMIQAMGSHTARADIKVLQRQLLLRGEPDLKALEAGIALLLYEDKRQALKEIDDCPISLISGTKDSLINDQGQQQLAQQNNISLFAIEAAGHAPFISHPKIFKQILKNIIL